MILSYLGCILIILGTCFTLISAVGLLRLEGVYQKMHAATKAGTLGNGLILLGILMQFKDSSSITELSLLILFIALTNPISAHLIAKVYHQQHKNNSD